MAAAENNVQRSSVIVRALYKGKIDRHDSHVILGRDIATHAVIHGVGAGRHERSRGGKMQDPGADELGILKVPLSRSFGLSTSWNGADRMTRYRRDADVTLRLRRRS